MKVQFGKYSLLLVGILIFHFLVNTFWIIKNNAPLPWDSANHLSLSIDILESIKSFDIQNILTASTYYPIAVYILNAFIFLIIYPSAKLSQFLGTLYFLSTLIIIYLYVKLLFKNERLAFFSTAIFSFFPVVFNWSRFLMLDIPSVGVLFLSLFFLHKSSNLENKKFSLFFFIAAGILALTKWTGLLYLLIPGVFTLRNFLQSNNKGPVIKNIIFGIAIFFAISLPWYLANFSELLTRSRIYEAGDPRANPQALLSIENLIEYPKIFYYAQATPMLAVIFATFLVVSVFLKTKFKSFLLLMIFGNLLLFSLIRDKDARFTMQILAFVGILTSLVVEQLILIKRKLGFLLYGLLLTFMLLLYLILNFYPSALDGTVVKKYDSNSWSMDTITSDLKEINQKGGGKVLVISEWEHLNPSNIRTYSKIAGLKNLSFFTPDIIYLKTNYQTDQFPNSEEIIKFVYKNDYLIIPERNIGSSFLLHKKSVEQVHFFIFPNEPLCREFQARTSPINTKCIILAGEKLTTGSDLIIDKETLTGKKTLEGFTEVDCKWGCSFGNASGEPLPDKIRLNLKSLKTYKLPNEEIIHLFEIN